MRGIFRLIDGLAAGDPTAVAVLAFAVVGTVFIVGVVMVVRRRRG
jgi:hypothetical protein